MHQPSKPRRPVPAEARQRGYSVWEVSLVIGAIAVIAVVVFLAFGDTQSSINQTRALNEINAVASSARQFRSTFAQGGLYTTIDMEELQGYNLAGMEVTGAAAASRGLNAYGLTVAIAPVSGATPANSDATITYITPSLEVCDDLRPLFTDSTTVAASAAADEHAPGFKNPVGCATGTLTLTLE